MSYVEHILGKWLLMIFNEESNVRGQGGSSKKDKTKVPWVHSKKAHVMIKLCCIIENVWKCRGQEEEIKGMYLEVDYYSEELKK